MAADSSFAGPGFIRLAFGGVFATVRDWRPAANGKIGDARFPHGIWPVFSLLSAKARRELRHVHGEEARGTFTSSCKLPWSLRRVIVRRASVALGSRPNRHGSRWQMTEARHPWNVVEQGDAADEAGFSCRSARRSCSRRRAIFIESGFAADPWCSADAGTIGGARRDSER
jgi:hypothetical protein